MSKLAAFCLGLSALAAVAAESPDIPMSRSKVNWCDWPKIHSENLERTKNAKFDFIFIGDSHTAGWANMGELVYNEYFAGYRILNLGISGDKTQNVLWRLQNGELDGQQDAKLAMLLIGSNNLFVKSADGDTPEATMRGVVKVVEELKKRLPRARIVVVGMPPNNEDDGDFTRTLAFNRLLKEYAKSDSQLVYLDIFDSYLKDGKQNADCFYEDMMHMRYDGYEIWAKAAKPLLDAALGK